MGEQKKISISQICNAALWSSVYIFTKFYQVDDPASCDAIFGCKVFQAPQLFTVLEELLAFPFLCFLPLSCTSFGHPPFLNINPVSPNKWQKGFCAYHQIFFFFFFSSLGAQVPPLSLLMIHSYYCFSIKPEHGWKECYLDDSQLCWCSVFCSWQYNSNNLQEKDSL